MTEMGVLWMLSNSIQALYRQGRRQGGAGGALAPPVFYCSVVS